MKQISKRLLGEYADRFASYASLDEVVYEELADALAGGRAGQTVITHRIKTTESVRSKMTRKAWKYHSIDEMTDIVGFRVICYFSDQVDVIASVIEELFEVDYERSCDKRTLFAPNTFGYLSLHYICSLRRDKGYPEELCDMVFEVQIRTMLQHTWAQIEHDLGYKSELAVPYEVRRDFARVASLLEIADEYFLDIKDRLRSYEEEVRDNIRNDKADDLLLNRVSLEEFIMSGSKMISLNNDIAAISGAAVLDTSPEPCLPLLQFFGITTIGDLKRLIDEERDHAVLLASKVLKDSEIDELISTVGLYYLFRAKLVYGDYSNSDIHRFCSLYDTNKETALRKAERIIAQREQR